MATTGAKYPTGGTSVSATGHAGQAWVNPGGIVSNNGTSTSDTTNCAYITSASYDTGVESYLLVARGFDFSAIPDGSVIQGVTVVWECWYAAGTANADLMQLLTTAATATPTGTNQCASPVAFANLATSTISKGSTSDKWGCALDSAWVKSANFGVCLGAAATALNTDIYCDCVTMEITYTAPNFITKAGGGAAGGIAGGSETVTHAVIYDTGGGGAAGAVGGGTKIFAHEYVKAGGGGAAGSGGGPKTVTQPVTLRNNFEAVPDATRISTANSGGTGNNPIDEISAAAGCEAAGYSTGVLHGSRCIRVTSPGTAIVYFGWTNASMTGSPARVYFRIYLKISAAPTINFRGGGNATLTGGVNIMATTGQFRLLGNSSMATVAETASSVCTGNWVRAEGYLEPGTVGGGGTDGFGQLQVWTTSPDAASSPDYDSTALTGRNTGTLATDTIRVGVCNSVAIAVTVDIDELGFSGTGPLGPVAATISKAGGSAAGGGGGGVQAVTYPATVSKAGGGAAGGCGGGVKVLAHVFTKAGGGSAGAAGGGSEAVTHPATATKTGGAAAGASGGGAKTVTAPGTVTKAGGGAGACCGGGTQAVTHPATVEKAGGQAAAGTGGGAQMVSGAGVTITSSCEAIPDATRLTAGAGGNTAGPGDTYFDEVSGAGANGADAVGYSGSPAHGARCIRFTSPGTAAVWIGWTETLMPGNPSRVYFRVAFRSTTAPLVNYRLLNVRRTTGTILCGGLNIIATTGQVRLLAGTGATTVVTSPAGICDGAWWRIEGYHEADPTGLAGKGRLQVFAGDSTTATYDSGDLTGVANGVTYANALRVGVCNAVATGAITVDLDDLGFSSAGPLGPVTGTLWVKAGGGAAAGTGGGGQTVTPAGTIVKAGGQAAGATGGGPKTVTSPGAVVKAGGGAAAGAGGGSEVKGLRCFATPAWNIHLLYQQDPVTTTRFFNNPGCFGQTATYDGTAPTFSRYDGLNYTPILMFKAKSTSVGLDACIANGHIGSFEWVYYDIESWAETPTAEKQDPFTAIPAFVAAAHAVGLKVLVSASLDLGNSSTGTAHDKGDVPGDHSNLSWWEYTWPNGDSMGKAISAADIGTVQTQSQTTDPAAYALLYQTVVAQAAAGGRAWTPIWCGTSASLGTAQQIADAITAAGGRGAHITIAPNDSAHCQIILDFLNLSVGAGAITKTGGSGPGAGGGGGKTVQHPAAATKAGGGPAAGTGGGAQQVTHPATVVKTGGGAAAPSGGGGKVIQQAGQQVKAGGGATAGQGGGAKTVTYPATATKAGGQAGGGFGGGPKTREKPKASGWAPGATGGGPKTITHPAVTAKAGGQAAGAGGGGDKATYRIYTKAGGGAPGCAGGGIQQVSATYYKAGGFAAGITGGGLAVATAPVILELAGGGAAAATGTGQGFLFPLLLPPLPAGVGAPYGMWEAGAPYGSWRAGPPWQAWSVGAPHD